MNNSLVIKNFNDYNDKKKIFKIHGRDVCNTKELSPCIVEVDVSGIRDIVMKSLNYDDISYSSLYIDLYSCVISSEMLWITGEVYYNGEDYSGVVKAFKKYIEDKEIRTRRQFNYHFDEKLCVHGIQFFEDLNFLVINFRSCDYINKFPIDLLLFKIMCDMYEVDIKKFYCFFGSLHIYNS